MGGEPAPTGAPFRVLLLGSVLRLDEFRFERQHAGVAGCDEGRRYHGMEILDLTALRNGRTAQAMHLGGAVVFGAVEGNQHVTAQTAERRQAIAGFKRPDRGVEHGLESAGRYGFEHCADVVVARDFGHLEQRLAVRAAAAFEQPALLREKRRALHEENRKRCHADIGHGVMDIAPASLVRQPGTDATHRRDERIEPLHAMVESDAPPKGHRKNLPESTRRSTSPTQSQNENRCLKAGKLAISFLRFPRIAGRDSVVASEGTMRPKERRDSGQADLLRSRLDAIIDMNHALVKLARTIDWSFLEVRVGAVYEYKPCRPPVPARH